MFDAYLSRWNLTPDGAPIVTHAARLLPVLHRGQPAMLKVSHEEDEKQGGVLMRWWDGHGAARVLAHDDEAIVLERATGGRSLAEYARNGRDDEATRIICGVLQELHAPRAKPLPELRPLESWFADLWPAARARGGILAESARHARALLDSQRDLAVLHGDAHHDNILDFGARGWLVIDPKRLYGERSTTQTSSAIRICRTPNRRWPSCPAASSDAWRSWPGKPAWSAAGCCNGWWPGAGCPPPGI